MKGVIPMMTAEVVPTEVHVERELVEQFNDGAVYVYRMVWEGSRVIEVHSFVPSGAEPDSCGIRDLMRAVP